MNERLPLAMLTRRTGAACDTAQKLAVALQPSDPPATLMVRLDSERQKLFSAMQ